MAPAPPPAPLPAPRPAAAPDVPLLAGRSAAASATPPPPPPPLPPPPAGPPGRGAAARTAALPSALADLEARVTACRACPRLVEWRERVAAERRAAFRDQEYWGRPLAGFGDPDAAIVVLGLAPAAHGGNRTGRVFTGDRSADWLYAALHRAGLANQPTSDHVDDGLVLRGAWVTTAVRCAPPANKPTPLERDRCAPWLAAELSLLPRATVVVALGAFAWTAAARHFGMRPRPAFGHGVEAAIPAWGALLGCYHPSQQNTFTGRLTAPMLDDVFTRAVALAAEASTVLDPGTSLARPEAPET